MQNHLTKLTRIIIGGVLAVVIWIAGILIGQEQTVTILNPDGGLSGIITRSRNIQVSLMMDYGDGRVRVYPEVKLIYGASALDLLNKVSITDKTFKITYEDYQTAAGAARLSINGYVTSANGKKWQVWLNNSWQAGHLDKIQLKSGDVIEFKYVKLVE